MDKDQKIMVLESNIVLHSNRIKALKERREHLKGMIRQHQKNIEDVEKEIQGHLLLGEVLAWGAEQLAQRSSEDTRTNQDKEG